MALLCGAVSGRSFTGGGDDEGIRTVVYAGELPAHVTDELIRAGLTLVESPSPEAAVIAGRFPLGVVTERQQNGYGRPHFFVEEGNNQAVQFVATFMAREAKRLGVADGLPSVSFARHPQPAADEMILVLLTMLVTVPAIGVTGAAAELGAGDKEGKTMELVLVTPVSPFVLAGAKIVAVTVAGLLAAVVAALVQGASVGRRARGAQAWCRSSAHSAAGDGRFLLAERPGPSH